MMDIKTYLYNTLTKSVDEFVPNEEGKVAMYTCGPTVYHFAHIGNLRSYIMEDVLEKYLRYVGYDVKRVMNITDVGHLTSDGDTGEDKMLKGAKREHKTVMDIARFYTDAFMADCEKLSIKRPDVVEPATNCIPEFIHMIEVLLEKGYAYIAGENVYFDTSKLDNYYVLSSQNEEDLQVGVREDVEEDTNKRNKTDFVLWFTKSKFDNQELKWDSPWGVGYPGWHIECSCIGIKHLGEYMDIHCGGVDNIFPHHTNEIAQSESYLGHKWCNYWFHVQHLNDKSGKMSKSKGDFLTVSLLQEKGYDPIVYRMFCLQSHYRKPLEFSYEIMDNTKAAYNKLVKRVAGLKKEGETDQNVFAEYKAKFVDAISNDLNTSMAITVLYDLLKADTNDITKYELIKDFDKVLSLNLENAFRMGGDSLDLSGMINLDQISLDVSGMPQMNLGDMIGSLNLTVKPGGMQKLSEGVMEGYQEYVKFHPEADYSNLAKDFMDYLMTDEAQKILKDNLQEIIESTGGFKITIDQMQELVQRVMEGYQKYAAEKGYTDPDKFGEYLAEYLQTEEAKEIMNTWQQEIFGDTVINITSDQLKKLTKELASSYPAYAAANGKADPTKMGDYFLNYLATADGKQRLMNGLSEVIDMDQLESQLSATMGSYMAKAMGTYTGAISDVLETQITSAMNQIVTQITEEIGNAMQAAMGNVGTQLQNMLGSSMKIDTDAFAKAFQMNMTEDDLKELMTSMTMSATASYDNNLQKLGYVDFANPSQISIYPTDFESKEKVVKILDSYNSRMEKEGKEEQIITYTDIVGTLMSSVTNIVDIISYVLIAFVAISLVVSSIMIGVITYISVLERKKEIGILRAIGASKRNVSQVFNAETVIIGLCAGLIGIGLSLLLLIPGNMIIHAVADNNKINAFLPVLPAIVLILLSIGLTLLGGIIPSRKAAKSDPVTALRTE